MVITMWMRIGFVLVVCFFDGGWCVHCGIYACGAGMLVLPDWGLATLTPWCVRGCVRRAGSSGM